MAVCLPDRKTRGKTLLPERQAFPSLGPPIQVDSSQLPTTARTKRSMPLKAAAAAIRAGQQRCSSIAESTPIAADGPA